MSCLTNSIFQNNYSDLRQPVDIATYQSVDLVECLAEVFPLSA
jgi:hypothetical protein